MLETVEIPAPGAHSATVIWLHGLGADGHDFEPVVPELRLPTGHGIRFVFPHAPVRPVTLNGGMAMRAWFDIYGLDRELRIDEAGIRAACDEVVKLVDREVERDIATERIVIAGFSQGGSLALVAALRLDRPLAGIIGLSCWLPRAFASVMPAQARTPVFLAHGTHDPVVGVDYGRESRDALIAAGMDLRWREYPMAHQVCLEEIADIRDFLLEAL